MTLYTYINKRAFVCEGLSVHPADHKFWTKDVNLFHKNRINNCALSFMSIVGHELRSTDPDAELHPTEQQTIP
ncbi:uncharacterized protein PHALS_14670 [Plasmopara halstedii]|uniref:Uncharacterized protein n=1 Tax=Plasmopara halstedii TaxID=4781 RepID=A0A0P1APJ0_PLAHL|nr:uncharacterized protein PHALS_14670 [Plasmopara halstedii]CEG42933.1 hypothetical protein PHALS_14670 [Plasmopara halstedii]|eukprot:XP_024579302.1 hypothetical protein PHALS_14670 [Plasmopara halstedii]